MKMEFEIKHKIDFEIEDLASSIIANADAFLYDSEPNYRILDDKQKRSLLKAIFSEAFEIYEEEEED